jgi:hypothetical protein
MVGRHDDDPWVDEDAGRLVRPYTVSNGRTRPTVTMDLLSMVTATGHLPRDPLDPDHAKALALCRSPATVAEIAAYLHLPAAITKVVLSDLVDCGAARTHAPYPIAEPTNHSVLERLLDGLQQRL